MKCSKSFVTYQLIIIGILFCFRMLTMFIMPLNDTTEARYAEIARKMLEKNDWITLWHTQTIPFWAKPPLSTWGSALSMKYLGINEFAARLPSLCFSLLTLYLIYLLLKPHYTKKIIALTIAILTSFSFFIINIGAVMTDPALLFSTTLIMVSFWKAVEEKSTLFGYLFFIGLGIGLLAKGPISWVLTGVSLSGYIILNRQYRATWKALPWFRGLLVTVVIALPWYYLAEQKTPGFLSYFIIGEHIGRFLQSGWHGDKYGFAHHAPIGMIWVFAFLGTLPFGLTGFIQMIKDRKKASNLTYHAPHFKPYLLCWAFGPLIFFTFARNIIYPYIFPSLPPFAILLLPPIYALLNEKYGHTIYYLNHAVMIVGLICLSIIGFTNPEWMSFSHKPLIDHYIQLKQHKTDKLYYAEPTIPFSAQFYSHNLASLFDNDKTINACLKQKKQCFIIKDELNPTAFSVTFKPMFVKLKTFWIGKHPWVLYTNQLTRQLK